MKQITEEIKTEESEKEITADNMVSKPPLFTNEALRKLVIPLIIEQFLAVAMGMADTLMVARCGEHAVSGISLVDTICVLMIGLFSAMSSGGAVVVAQFKGKGDKKMVNRAANQIFLAVGSVAILFMAVALIGNYGILKLIYGQIEPEVMTAARTYFYFAAISFPFLGIYNSGAALFRAIGNSKISMKVSLVANVLNVIGNAILIFIFDMGVAGAAISTLFSRVLSAVLIMVMVAKSEEISLDKRWRPDFGMLHKILYIGIPSGMENSMFQLGKLLLSSLVSTFGTVAITANAVTNSVGSFQNIPATAIGTAMVTVVGQCIGAGEVKQAKQYIKKLLMVSYTSIILLGAILIVFARPIFNSYNLSADTMDLAIQLLTYSAICGMFLHPLSFGLGHALRAAGDVTYTMTASIASMWICRIFIAYVLADHMGMGVMGVWIAMTLDWAVRSIFFTTRIHTGKWLKHINRIV